jgi:hypothetical protein
VEAKMKWVHPGTARALRVQLAKHTAGLALMALAAAIPAARSDAAVISFFGKNSDQTGTGFGHVLEVLDVQNGPSESGAVLWDGSKDVASGDAKNQGDTRSVTDLTGQGIDATHFSVIFNISQPKSSDPLDLHNFDLVFQNAAGQTLFTAAFDPSDGANASTAGLTADGQGVGQSGYEFPVTFTPAEATLFFGTSTNRVGMEILSNHAIDNTTAGGPEGFYVAKAAAVPEPASGLAMAGLAGAMLLRRGRRV